MSTSTGRNVHYFHCWIVLLALFIAIYLVMEYYKHLNYEPISMIDDVYNGYIDDESVIQQQIIGGNRWPGYRLGDIFKHRLYRIDFWGYEWHTKQFPDSIAVEYLQQMKNNKKPNDFRVLLNIINNRSQLYPPNNTVVIHLRTGDVLDVSKYERQQNLEIYAQPTVYFGKLLSKMQSFNISKAVFVTGFHCRPNMNHSNTLKYIMKVKHFFETNYFETMFRINNKPDDDVIFMSNSKYFVQSDGGFSSLVANIVRLKGGYVINYNKRYSFGWLTKQQRKKLAKIDTYFPNNWAWITNKPNGSFAIVITNGSVIKFGDLNP